MFLITGATGNVGGALVRILEADGHEVRAFVRDPARAEDFSERVQLAVGDLDRPETVAAALEGVNAVFHMQSSHGTEQTETMASAAQAAGVGRVVALSSMGAALNPPPIMGRWFIAREEVLEASGLETTFLRPSTLMANALQWAASTRDEGCVRDPVGPGRLSSIDTDDVAAVAAATLTGPGHGGKAYTLTGRELLTVREQVAILARVLNRDIAYVEQTPEEAAQASIVAGTPEDAAEAMRDLNEMFRADGIAFLTEAVEELTGRQANAFEAWCRRNAGRFL